ncbi:aminoglycoside phosphotransferase family protein (plasmid) [Streptomyces sp. BI20]|uniref:aminoglycoside phosphotransferase family protein n=1 Tax=Streptomyces sp. BI20 TaxID=3403460 RepID=UPI003C7329F6
MPDGPAEERVRELVAAALPAWAGLPVRRLRSDGTVNAVYRLGDALSIRIPFTVEGTSDVARDELLLPRLAPLLPVPVPEPLAVVAPSAEHPATWGVYRWREGVHPVAGALERPEDLARDLAGFVAAMRAVTPVDGPRAHRGGPLADQDAEVREALAALAGLPEENVDVELLTEVWEDGLEAAAGGFAPVWLHADLMPGNLLVSEDGRLTSVIDFGCAGVGDPACDLFPAWNLLPASARGVFRGALGVDGATWRRGRARTLAQAAVALPWYRGRNRGMSENARHVLREVTREWRAAR